MSRISILIDTDNDAFINERRGIEVARILRKVADEYEKGAWLTNTLMDINGNEVGEVFDEEEPTPRSEYDLEDDFDKDQKEKMLESIYNQLSED